MLVGQSWLWSPLKSAGGFSGTDVWERVEVDVPGIIDVQLSRSTQPGIS